MAGNEVRVYPPKRLGLRTGLCYASSPCRRAERALTTAGLRRWAGPSSKLTLAAFQRPGMTRPPEMLRFALMKLFIVFVDLAKG
jgi:hypothetical protein